jgi:hypothetical protein
MSDHLTMRIDQGHVDLSLWDGSGYRRLDGQYVREAWLFMGCKDPNIRMGGCLSEEEVEKLWCFLDGWLERSKANA